MAGIAQILEERRRNAPTILIQIRFQTMINQVTIGFPRSLRMTGAEKRQFGHGFHNFRRRIGLTEVPVHFRISEDSGFWVLRPPVLRRLFPGANSQEILDILERELGTSYLDAGINPTIETYMDDISTRIFQKRELI